MKKLVAAACLVGLLALPAPAFAWHRGTSLGGAAAHGAMRGLTKRFYDDRRDYRNYRERMEVENQKRAEKGKPPLRIKPFREWRRWK